jgi:hypothetical protein
MDGRDRQTIQTNIDLLSQSIDLNSIIPLVLNKNIFTQPMIDDILVFILNLFTFYLFVSNLVIFF